MSKQIQLLLVVILTGFSTLAGELEDALISVSAPAGEYVRMPSRYIFQQLEKTAQNSGLPILGGFSIDVQLEGAENKKVTVNFYGMNLVQALDAVALATGTKLEFSGTAAVLADPAAGRIMKPKVVEEPVNEKDDGGKVEFTDIDSALVFVDTGVGSGSAFIAAQDGKTYLFSNQHNFMGANKLEFRSMHSGLVDFDTFEFCRSRDLVRFALNPEKVEDLGVLKLSEKTPYIDQPIVVYGNSAGANVATELRGKVLGVGPRDIEVDADIVSGNSGSPILDSEGNVLGVATYIAFEMKFDKKDERSQIFKGTRFGKARRYGVRIPKDGWIQVDLRPFLQQTYVIADMSSYLEIMHVLVEYWGGDDDYEEAANQILSSYSSRSDRVTAPYEFHSMQTEDDLRLLVKAFKRNYDEFVELVRKADLSKRDLEKLTNPKSLTSSSKVERLDYHIRTTLLSKVRRLQDDLKQNWMSDYLAESAVPLNELSSDLLLKLESEKGLRERIKAVM
ncbi:serine protease [Pontiellaceae bacterium B12219]|nr:serine protease [Pontiellaceae bacterium B12219]